LFIVVVDIVLILGVRVVIVGALCCIDCWNRVKEGVFEGVENGEDVKSGRWAFLLIELFNAFKPYNCGLILILDLYKPCRLLYEIRLMTNIWGFEKKWGQKEGLTQIRRKRRIIFILRTKPLSHPAHLCSFSLLSFALLRLHLPSIFQHNTSNTSPTTHVHHKYLSHYHIDPSHLNSY
jgi:hypothetical protein